MEGEVLLSHKRTGRLVGSFGGWFLNRAFDAIGAEALSPPVDQRAAAAFLYEEVESAHATLQFGGRFDHSTSTPEGGPRAQLQRVVGIGRPGVEAGGREDNCRLALNLARASRYPSLEELYYFGPHPGNLRSRSATTSSPRNMRWDSTSRCARAARGSRGVSFFRNDITNYIFRQPTGEVEDDFPVDAATSRAR